jgi:transposase
MAKNKLPHWVSAHKKEGQTIKVRGEKYYLYEQKCVYDSSKKHKNTTVDVYLGTITKENGFVPKKIPKSMAPDSIVSKTFGTYCLVNHCCADVRRRLERQFGDHANLIYTIAALRLIEKTPYCDLETEYEGSYFSVCDKTLPMSKSSLSDFLVSLSRMKSGFVQFMRADVEEDDILIFDGTNLLCGSHRISYSGKGYRHGHNYPAQVNQLYACSAGKRKPVYYKLLEGSVSDSKSLSDILDEAGIENGIAIIDNGFASGDNLAALISHKEKYILALRRDSKYVADEILEDGFGLGCAEKFTNNHESVFAYETKDENGDRICIYFNQTIRGVETSEYLDKIKRGWGGFTEENYKVDCKRFGIYVLKTNVGFSLQKTYEYYKTRFEIEYLFDTVKNTLEFDKVYMHSDRALESWAFINHISILMTQKIYDCLAEKEVPYSFHSTMRMLKQVVVGRTVTNTTDDYKLHVVPAKTRKLLEKLGLDI